MAIWPIRSICCSGADYVGGPTMAVIADRCPEAQVTVVDLNAERIAAWNDGDLSRLPVCETGLDAVVGRARGSNLHFSTEVDAANAAADMVILSVKTPPRPAGWVPARPATRADSKSVPVSLGGASYEEACG